MSRSDEQFVVVIISPDQILWEGKATSLSSRNSTGEFDILPGHANFVTIVKNDDIKIRTIDGNIKTISKKNCIVSMVRNKATIYIEI